MRDSKIPALLIGLIVIIFGLSVIFDFNFPIFRILLGVFFIALGISVIFKKPVLCSISNSTGNRYVRSDNMNIEKEYTTVFGRGRYDFTDLEITDKTIKTQVSVVFGSVEFKIPAGMPVVITVQTVFAGGSIPPEKTLGAFGKDVYRTVDSDVVPHLDVQVDAVFGNFTLIEV